MLSPSSSQLQHSGAFIASSCTRPPLCSRNYEQYQQINGDQDKNKTMKKKKKKQKIVDRHSKIWTAQGVRDRRVRLSVEIAQEFFHLQDMLGFDRASETLEWLLANSGNAIADLLVANNNHKMITTNNHQHHQPPICTEKRPRHDHHHQFGSPSLHHLSVDSPPNATTTRSGLIANHSHHQHGYLPRSKI